MIVTFNEEMWMWSIINNNGIILARVIDEKLCNLLSRLYQDQEDEYYNNIEYKDADSQLFNFY